MIEIGTMGFPYRASAIATGAAMLAEAEGVDALWYPDHLMAWHPRALWREAGGVLAEVVDDPHAYSDPFVAATVALMATRRPRIGIAVTDTYRRHPATIAQAAATLSELAPGRFVLGLGSGEGLNTAPLGLERVRPVQRLGEALEIITRLLGTDGPVSFDGRHFTLDRLPGMASSRTADTPPVEIVLGGHSDALLDLVGRYGTGWLPVLPSTPAHYAARLAVARRAAEQSGRDPAEIVPGIYLYAVIHEDHDVAVKALEGMLLRIQALAGNSALFAQAGLEHPLGPGFAGLRDYIPEWVPTATVRDAANDLPVEGAQHFVLHGTPGEIVAHLQPFVDAGVRRVVLDNLLPLGIPEELEGANRATRAAIRAARLTFRGAP
ncbi:MAG: LLM class flavin-dependent oxidoreductase [Acidimicrobiia bacterium]